MHIRTHENVVPLPPLSLRLPCRFSSSCTSTPSFFCLALAPSRYSRRITELRTKIEGNGATAAAAFLLFSSVPSRSFYRVSNAFLDLSQKFRPHLRPIIGWIISIWYIYITSVKLNIRGPRRRRAVRWSMRSRQEFVARIPCLMARSTRPVSRDWFKGWGSRCRDQGVFLVEIQVRRRINRIRLEIVGTKICPSLRDRRTADPRYER